MFYNFSIKLINYQLQYLYEHFSFLYQIFIRDGIHIKKKRLMERNSDAANQQRFFFLHRNYKCSANIFFFISGQD